MNVRLCPLTAGWLMENIVTAGGIGLLGVLRSGWFYVVGLRLCLGSALALNM